MLSYLLWVYIITLKYTCGLEKLHDIEPSLIVQASRGNSYRVDVTVAPDRRMKIFDLLYFLFHCLIFLLKSHR